LQEDEIPQELEELCIPINCQSSFNNKHSIRLTGAWLIPDEFDLFKH
jgi:hypothetical protein